MTDKRWNNFISNPWYLGAPIVHLSFLPLAHTMERQHISIVYPYGGRVGFYSGVCNKICVKIIKKGRVSNFRGCART